MIKRHTLFFIKENTTYMTTHTTGRMSERLSYRVPILKPAVVSIGSNRYIGCLGNISSSGVFLHTTEELTTGSVANLTFSLPGEERFFTSRGVVKWSTDSVMGKKYLKGAGIMFTSIALEDQKIIERFIADEAERL